jgi:hypothetical protein
MSKNNILAGLAICMAAFVALPLITHLANLATAKPAIAGDRGALDAQRDFQNARTESYYRMEPSLKFSADGHLKKQHPIRAVLFFEMP